MADPIYKRILNRYSENMEAVGKYLVRRIKQRIGRPNPTGDNPSLPGEPPKRVTGDLSKSINYRLAGFNLEIRADSEHAMYLEFGTRFMAARPFLTATIDMSRAQIKKRLAK